jgi:putative methyltransferase (TIGR04325 family)
MKQCLKNLLRRYLPAPLLARLTRSRRIHFSGPYSSWQVACTHATGYHVPSILERVAAATREVVAGRAAFERDSVTFSECIPDPVIFAILSSAMPHSGALRILDFGGSLGSSYHQHRRFLPKESHIEWHIIEQSNYVACGQAEFQTTELRFHQTIEDACKAGPPHVVLLSSVLQYLETPWQVVAAIGRLPASCWVVSRTPFHKGASDLTVVQHVPASIYRASYPAWILSETKFMDLLNANGFSVTWHTAPEGEINDGNLSFVFRTATCHRG